MKGGPGGGVVDGLDDAEVSDHEAETPPVAVAMHEEAAQKPVSVRVCDELGGQWSFYEVLEYKLLDSFCKLASTIFLCFSIYLILLLFTSPPYLAYQLFLYAAAVLRCACVLSIVLIFLLPH